MNTKVTQESKFAKDALEKYRLCVFHLRIPYTLDFVPIVSCPRLLVQHICSYPSYLGAQGRAQLRRTLLSNLNFKPRLITRCNEYLKTVKNWRTEDTWDVCSYLLQVAHMGLAGSIMPLVDSERSPFWTSDSSDLSCFTLSRVCENWCSW
jgi:hypothetical protein